ncbi:GlcG/HbpS family heme-binding protein [Pseudomonas rubra]|uniref:Heme-binding protein n=1 Tax=Pseudomonas rubra TaxID=2942627 RepID=A0ABT5P1E0_9PSED|nr:heme-binding protein [Pseudomonas rubra]MDD1012089.1 heme-binding protein [Pseudomonas rubra]MDD1038475.1 heme-binding protein [Pseudomonas rubra]MDD1153512.1 heme-binding protein [Pseudomonas rubra]
MKRSSTVLCFAMVALISACQARPLSHSPATLGFEAALQLAISARQACARQGFAVAVSVVDRQAQPLVLLVSDDAFGHSRQTSERKARTAASRRAPTAAIASANDHEQSLSLAFHTIGLTTLSGGVPVVLDNQVIGAVGVAGAPGQNALGQDFDSLCAEAGIKAIGAQWTVNAETAQ